MEETQPSVVVEKGKKWFPAAFLSGSYAALCALVIYGVIVAGSLRTGGVGLPDDLAPWEVLAMILAGVLFALLIIRKVKVRMAWELILGMTLFLGAWFYAWLLFPLSLAVLLAALFTLLQGTVRRVWIHNVFMLVGAAGMSLNFAFALSDKTLLILLVCLALYDTFAGRPGGVMAEFAASLVHRGVIPGLIVPGRIRDIVAPVLEAVKRADASFLGAGDLILPLTLVARASASGMLQGITVAVGIILAACWLGSRGPTKPFPALVPLAICSIVPYLALFFLQQL
jgi:presenilin-like A22 family membrane protease